MLPTAQYNRESTRWRKANAIRDRHAGLERNEEDLMLRPNTDDDRKDIMASGKADDHVPLRSVEVRLVCPVSSTAAQISSANVLKGNITKRESF